MRGVGNKVGEPKRHVCNPRTHVISELERVWRSADPPSPGTLGETEAWEE